MKTTFELGTKISGKGKKSIFENLNMLENIWNVEVDNDLARVSFDYMASADLHLVRRELHELGYHIINDTHRFDAPEKPL
ncbi:hypothetical protein [Maribacter sp. ACAM166]|uniref:hypothetical protein n=1 Tax=Maribacter sp. ACAM166 TaxID=2508996 RepID=UPI0010FD08A0|nr:hypothetical protein [Maribacter sp. ACAM166]TLP81809.1 hypothetical protein ES765_03785 [Maribacter sp. ACAM166]